MRISTLEEECRELWEALVEGAGRSGGDSDCAEACDRLLRHLLVVERAAIRPPAGMAN